MKRTFIQTMCGAKALTLVFAALACVAFTSCGNDDEENTGNSIPAELVGTWNVETYGSTFTFNEDGTGYMARLIVNDVEESDSKTRATWQMVQYDFTYSYVIDSRQLTMNIQQMGDLVWKDVNISNGSLTATDSEVGSVTATKVSGSTGGSTTGITTVNGHEAIDLGLSVKWATCNIGASVPSKFGEYYAWGETEEKDKYSHGTYSHALLSPSGNLEGYVNIGSDISNTNYDVAYKKWGEGWRIPTKKEIEELKEKCEWEWTLYNMIVRKITYVQVVHVIEK